MSTHLKELFSQKTTEELLEVLQKFEKYTSTAIAVAIDELKSRGYSISEEELQTMNEVIEKEKEDERKNKLFDLSLAKNIVADPNVPFLYSRSAIWWFSFIFSPIFGSVLLALNLQNKGQKAVVISVGALLSLLIMLWAEVNYYFSIFQQEVFFYFAIFVFNSIGGFFLANEFWKKYIGRDTKYRVKPIWIPLIFTVVIVMIVSIFAI